MERHLPCNVCFNTRVYISFPNPVSSGSSHPRGGFLLKKGTVRWGLQLVTVCTNTLRAILDVPHTHTRKDHGFVLWKHKSRGLFTFQNQIKWSFHLCWLTFSLLFTRIAMCFSAELLQARCSTAHPSAGDYFIPGAGFAFAFVALHGISCQLSHLVSWGTLTLPSRISAVPLGIWWNSQTDGGVLFSTHQVADENIKQQYSLCWPLENVTGIWLQVRLALQSLPLSPVLQPVFHLRIQSVWA